MKILKLELLIKHHWSVCAGELTVWAIAVVSLFSGCEEDRPYNYDAYDSTGVHIVTGWFWITEQDSSAIAGEWEFFKVENLENIGPQIGSGHFIGYQKSTEIQLELNPDMADNNVSLYGTFTGTTINGEWQCTGFPGLINEGSFHAKK